MGDPKRLFTFILDERTYALKLSVVETVVRAVEITPLLQAPESVLGIVNVHGSIIPVMNLRKRFRLPQRAIDTSDHLVIAHTATRKVALTADRTIGVIEPPERDVVQPDAILPGLEYVEGVAKLEGDIILIHDLDRFLSLEEEGELDSALKENHDHDGR